jgi:hypothetical protein
MGANQLQIDEINELIQAIEERIEVLVLHLEKVDEFANPDAYRAIASQIQALSDEQNILSQRRNELTAG